MAFVGLGDLAISPKFLLLLPAVVLAALFARIIYNFYFHPLAKYRGPWYARTTSLVSAIISLRRVENHWLLSLTEKYGWDEPIRIAPNMLLFPNPSSLKDIYWDPKTNQKSMLYGTGALGPPHIFAILDGEEHKQLRKALNNAPWTSGQLKHTWEPKIDDHVQLFTSKMTEFGEAGSVVVLSDKLAEFAADIMSMFSFSTPFGFVRNSRDEKQILEKWRKGLNYFGFVGRVRTPLGVGDLSTFYRDRFTFWHNHLMKWPYFKVWCLPAVSDDHGMGYLMAEADRQVTQREKDIEEGTYKDKGEQKDFMQHCLEARRLGKPLSGVEKRAHCTLLIQAGADTTGTALGSTMRYILTTPGVLDKVRAELETAEKDGKLSNPILYEETRIHLPYFVACIKEGLRLDPPATNLFARTVKNAQIIDGHAVPAGVDVTTNAYVVQRDPEMYGPDPLAFRPERWLEGAEKAFQMDAHSFTFGMGPRVCFGKDIAIMELYKLLPETVRRFNFEVVNVGHYEVAGGVAYNVDFRVKLTRRDGEK